MLLLLPSGRKAIAPGLATSAVRILYLDFDFI